MDIDISVQISSYSQMDQFRKRLSKKNIYPAASETVMYRFSYQDILIDFIPDEDTPMGPTNSWIKPGFRKFYPVRIQETKSEIIECHLNPYEAIERGVLLVEKIRQLAYMKIN